ncbi:MAG: AAA family ATPase [Planctomycetota bacterium]
MAKKTSKKVTKRAPRKRAPVLEDLPEGEPLPVPVGLGEILGHAAAIGTLTQALDSDRLHHAWIFHGPKGVGKCTTALAFAAMLLDPTTDRGLSGELAPDPDSATQHLLRGSGHPDLHLIYKELARYSSEASVRNSKLTSIPKDVVETHLLKPAHLAPQSELSLGAAARKVFIVDEAHMLDPRGSGVVQNALLKTLEEPAEGTVIILVTNSEERLLPTIRSRCQRVSFGSLDHDAMHTWLAQTDTGIRPADQDWLIAYAEGSPGRLLRAADAGLADWARTLEPMLRLADAGKLSPEFGPAMDGLAQEWAKAHVAKDQRRSKEAANREAAAMLFSVIATRCRARMRDGKDTDAAVRTIDAIAEAEHRLAANVNTEVVYNWLAAVIAAPIPVVTRIG